MLVEEEDMKKFALGILSVFMIMAGVLLSACDKKVSLSVSTEEVVIYTNYDKEGDYQSKTVDVSLKNSSDGVRVEILKGGDSIRLSSVKKKTSENYSFTIYGDKSGEAEVRVSSIEDNSQSAIINVKVNTVLEYLERLPDDTVDARTNKFAVKGVEKELNVDDYFTITPVTANIKDIEWSFVDEVVTGAQIVDGNKLLVSEDFTGTYIDLKASFTKNKEKNGTVRFEVLDNSTINSFVLGEENIYTNGALVSTDDFVFDLVRNNAKSSSVNGVIEFNTAYAVNLDLDVYQKNADGTFEKLSQEVYKDYFLFNVLRKQSNETSKKVTYTFQIESLDSSSINKFGDFYFVLKAGYANYNYDISTYDMTSKTGASIVLNTLYSATRVELFNDGDDVINDSTIDVFSNYTTGNGYKIKISVLPDEVAVDNDYVYISISKQELVGLDLPSKNPISSLAKFYYRGSEILFEVDENDPQYYKSTTLVKAGTELYVSSVKNCDKPVKFEFTSASKHAQDVSTSLTMNLYQITTGERLELSKFDGGELDEISYLSSTQSSTRTKTFEMRVKGISTMAGLSLKTDNNSKFDFSDLVLIPNEDGDDENSVKVQFTVALNGYNFADSSKFWLEHITGKKSAEFTISAFVPLTSASVKNGDKSSSSVYADVETNQGFSLEETGIKNYGTIVDSSVSKLMLEAGTILPLNMNYRNASLSARGVYYKYLAYSDLFDVLKNTGATEETAEQLIKNMIESNNSGIENYYQYFDLKDGMPFSIADGKLVLTDNSFNGFVCVLFAGYDEDHREITLARFFYLESLYSVRFLSSNVKTTLLYTTETLSLTDIDRASASVTISMRSDEKVPTYSNNLQYFTFSSAIMDFQVNDARDYWYNDYYEISDLSFTSSGRYLKFKLTANSTKLQTSVKDILTVSYCDDNGFSRETEIQIEIKNERRIESVQWLNRTEDDEIYLNLTTTVTSERSFTISTSVYPSEANDLGLSHVYFATAGTANDLSITTSSSGQTFNLNINTSTGSYGNLFLLPNDMVKIVDGVRQVLLYKYTEDTNGNIIETPIYKKLSELYLYYDNMIEEGDEFSTYFYNNDGEKVYYKDTIIKISVVIADGMSEGTAIRIYNEGDLLNIDTAKYYKIMNNLTLNNWRSYDRFSGMIFGKDESVSLKFEGDSENFVGTLSGTIKNLTFAGNVTVPDTYIQNGGFVANENNGLIENVVVDVYYGDDTYVDTAGVTQKYKRYMPSTVNSIARYVGGVVGQNNGTINNAYVYGLSIVSNYTGGDANYTGGIAGYNAGKISNSGVEFYNFSKKENENTQTTVKNIFKANGSIGGISGFGGDKSVIEKSYAYAYSLNDSTNAQIGKIFENGSVAKGAFSAGMSTGAVVKESFAFMGNLIAPFVSITNANTANFTNSYITYFRNNVLTTRIFKDANFSYANEIYSGTGIVDDYVLLASVDLPADYTDSTTYSDKWKKLVSGDSKLDSSIWELSDIDTNINFGFMYLKNVIQSASVNVENISLANNTNPLKSLNAGKDATTGVEKGILFVYDTTATPSTSAEQSALVRYNTISIAELFGVTEKQARSLLVSTDSKNVSITTTSIRLLSKNANKFELSVHSKMDFTNSKTFEVVVLNYLPELKTTINQSEIKQGRTILLQTGTSNSQTIMYNTNNTIYLNGNGYSTRRDGFVIEYNLKTAAGVELENDEHISISKNSNSLNLIGDKAHDGDDYTALNSYLVVADVADDAEYSATIKNARKRDFKVSVYNGATALVIDNASSLVVKPSQYAVFDVTLDTDYDGDDLVFSLKYGSVDVDLQTLSDNSIRFKVDSNLSIDLSWTKSKITETRYGFKVLVKISDDFKHLVDSDYDNLILNINAKSQNTNSKYAKSLALSVRTQEIEDIGMASYNIESRQFVRSVLYYKMADEITNTLVPSSDAVVAVSINPAYAKMTHFTLTYTVSGTSVGTVSLSRLKYNERYGYYVDTSSTSLITNGIQVNLLEADKTGNGMFYFRMYISSSFASNSELKLTLTCYDGNTVLTNGTHSLSVNYLQEARVRVGGASTYILAKGDSATVQVVTALDQELSELYLKNNYANISLSQPTVEVFDDYKLYTATLIAYVDAKLQDNLESGIFYVCATVQRSINNRLEIKESRATVCLVDFSVDGSGISISSNAGKTTYNGKSYDTFYSYVNSTDTLSFDYPMLPTSYTYDQNDVNEVAAVEKLMKSRNEFALNNYYKDENVGYYINCAYNDKTGVYDEIQLKRQLWYATDEETSTAICNDSGIVQKDVFRIDEVEFNNNGLSGTYLTITGKRTGRQLMKLRTTILYQGIEFSYDYYFLVVIDLWTDEESPTQIFTADEFIKYAKDSEKAGDYILMNDIVLNDYTPLDTDLIKSLDGNGYTIHINSFAMPESGSSLKLALFNSVDEDSTLKNIRVNIYNGGQISVNVSQYTDIDIAGFAIENNGVIYNCEVVSYYDENYQSSAISGDTGLVVKYTLGANTDPINLTTAMVSAMGIESKVSGFVSQNNASIMNSRVGGESIRTILSVAETSYIKAQTLGDFVIEGQGEVAGFANTNSASAYISASFADNVQIYNKMAATTSITAGFVGYNSNKIQNSYVEGRREGFVTSDNNNVYNNLTNISSIGIIAGFVYENSALIKNSYANIAIENSSSKASLVAGFVYKNESDGEIKLCYAACEITKSDVNQMLFSGVDDFSNSLNNGTISFSYYFNGTRDETTAQSKVTPGVLAVTDISKQDSFYGFSFATDSESYNGIWEISDDGLTLVSPDKIAFSNRYGVTNTSGITTIFYNKSLIDADNMKRVDISYGSENNPIIIRNAYDFAVATGKATTKEISSYKEYYSDSEVNGNYRLVNNIDMSEIDQNAENDNSIKLTTTSKTFTGILDGNGFTISNINLGSSVVTENYGLFAKLDGANIMNLDLVVDSIHNSQANIVGTLAGTAVNSRILAITLSPVSSQSTSVQKTSILGNNIVGGVVGMMFGESSFSDIQVKDIDIYSSYYMRNKTIDVNDNYVGQKLRINIQNKASIYSYVSKVSYAGGIAGYVDIYNTISSEYVKYSNTLEVSDYDIITVHVSDAVNIYGEVAGGLFGYVGNSTYIYDAKIELDADMNLTKPSYIISKNLYAGGLIGENYGGLFAVSASYAEDLQDTIEENENAYYSGSLSAERGQQSIFSYTANDEGYISNINAPLYVGGLVGYMGGGYIYIGYNKLNVISHSSSTLAVGGIVGIAGYTANLFDLNFVTNAPKVNVLLNDVYASGDVYVDGRNADGEIVGDAAGIIGAIENNEGAMSIVGLKDVVAANYYSYNGIQFVGDDAVANNGEYVSDHHYILVGKIYDASNKEAEILNSALYLIDSDDNYINIAKTTETTSVGSLTVGGYNSVSIGAAKLDLLPFGFSLSWTPKYQAPTKDPTEEPSQYQTRLDKYNQEYQKAYDNYVKSLFAGVLSVESIGNNSMSTMSAAYAKMYTYFLSNGWSDKFWNHEEEHLFPSIQLLSKANMIYWDVFNTQEVLQKMQNSGVTVVVRGRVSNDDVNIQYSDIDLTDIEVTKEDYNLISGFKGTLISYYDYMNSEDAGFVTTEIEKNGKVVGGHKANGNTAADKVGIILNKALFRSIDSDVLIQGINFYYQPSAKNYMLVDGGLSSTVFRDVNIVVNSDINLETVNSGLDFYTTGLVAKTAYASSFINMGVKLRYGAQITIAHKVVCQDVYIGLLAGYMQQTSSSKQMFVQGINIEREVQTASESTDVSFEIKITENTAKNIYAGLYAGKISKGSGNSAKIGIGITNPGKVKLNVKVVGDDGKVIKSNNANLTIGGFVGEINAVDNVVTVNNAETAGKESNLSILLNSGLANLKAGLAFGAIENSNLTIANEIGIDAKLVGGVYEVDDISFETAQIGGIAGKLSSITEINGYSVDFSVGMIKNENDNVPTYLVNEEDKNSTETYFDQNLNDYSSKLHPFVIKGGDEDSIGGFYGMASGGAVVSITGTCEISGNIDVKVSKDKNNATLSIGGVVGQIAGTFITRTSIKDSLNVAIVNGNQNNETTFTTTAYIGGLIGKVAKYSGAKVDINNSSNIGYNIYYTGTVLSSVDKLVFGGAIGYIEQGLDKDDNANYTSDNENVKISKFVYGGAVKIYGTFTNKKVTTGGVVGEYVLPKSGSKTDQTKYVITDCFTYGDVFVNYNASEEAANKLGEYKFGGIVGVASYIKIENCTSIMTSFNSRDAYGSGEKGKIAINETIGAIVGGNSENVIYNGNYYSSGVCLAYQEELGNADIAYTEVSGGNYSGYTSVTKKTGDGDISLETTENALNIAMTIYNISTEGVIATGHKLNPYRFGSNDIRKKINDDIKLEGNLHNISWVSLSENLNGDTDSLNDVIADNLTNVAFVGNGRVVTRKDNENNISVGGNVNFGALVNSLGKDYDPDGDKEPNFSVISGLVIDLNMLTTDLEDDSHNKNTSFGGVVGQMSGNSFIYGVGVKGDLSIGGDNIVLQLAGLVGVLNSGLIDQCYVDADITYRAGNNAGSSIAGAVADVSDERNSIIRSTYTSGRLETYADIPMYTFACRRSAKNTYQSWMIDCYSISQIKRNNALNSQEFEKGISFASDGFSQGGVVIDGCYDTDTAWKTLNTSNSDKKIKGEIALVYSDTDGICSSKEIKSEKDTKLGEFYSSINRWYFNPYVNYGYASHGFGWLKNVTTYTRTNDTKNEGENKDRIQEYTYTPISYSDVVSYGDSYGKETDEWYLGVLNQDKFNQMLATVASDETLSYDKNYRFVLRYDFKVTNLGKNIGANNREFVLDGNNTTIDLASKSSKTGLFNNVVGTIENLKITNANIENIANDNVGVLAGIVTGDIRNISVSGQIVSSGDDLAQARYVGGVVGSIKGKGSFLTSTVYIKSSSQRTIVGGVVGKVEGGTISYASNAGIIVDSYGNSRPKTSMSSEGIVVKVEGIKENYVKVGVHSLAGGVVGLATGSEISNSYNANSVLVGYTNEKTGTYVAGGIVGFSIGSSIENCYNTGLVGAGNYSNEVEQDTNKYMSFAGGIFGHATEEESSAKTSVKDCMNDGAVQALGVVLDAKADYSITIKYKSGTEKMTKYASSEIAPLVYTVTMTYNKGATRSVYAYGIGYTTSGTIQNCDSSTDNIKNDGNIGEYVYTTELKFDRQDILDNGNGENHSGKFAVDKNDGNVNYTISGYDAYGFPARIYVKDTVERIYTGTDIKEREKEYETHYKDGWFATWAETNGVSKYDYKTSKWETLKDENWKEIDLKDGDTGLFATNPSYFEMGATTTYYQSATFVGLENIMGFETDDIGAVGFDKNGDVKSSLEYSEENGKKVRKDNYNAKTRNNSISEDVNSKIAEIDEQRQSNKSGTITTINGKKTMIAYNVDQFRMVYYAYQYTLEPIYFTSTEYPYIDFTRLSSGDFEISATNLGYADKTFTKYDNGTGGILNATLYGSEEISNITVTMKYNSTPKDLILTKNNVVGTNGNLKIYFNDGTNNFVAPSWDESVGDEISWNVKVGDVILSPSDYEIESGGDYLTYTGTRSKSYFEGKELTLSYTIKVEDTASALCDLKLSEKSGIEQSLTISDQEIVNFKNYEEIENASTWLNDYTNIFDESGNSKIKINIDALLNGNDEVSGLKNNQTMVVGTDENNKIVIKKNSVGVVSANSDSESIVYSDEDGNYLIVDPLLYENLSNFKIYRTCTVYAESKPSTTKEEEYDNNGLKFKYKAKLVDNGNFRTDGTYTGSSFSGADQQLLGISNVFYVNRVSFGYKVESVSISSANDFGYKILFKKSEIEKLLRLGSFIDGKEEVFDISNLDVDKCVVNVISTKASLVSAEEYDYDTNEIKYNDTIEFSTTEKNSNEDDCLINYSISNSVINCPICQKDEYAVVTTMTGLNDRNTKYSYVYYVFDCGSLMVDYEVLGKTPFNKDAKEQNAPRRFVMDKEGNITTYKKNPNDKTEVSDGDSTYDYYNWLMSTKDIKQDGVLSNFYSGFTPTDKISSAETIYLKYVATYFDNKQILFGIGSGDISGIDVNRIYKREGETGNSSEITLFTQGKDESYTITSTDTGVRNFDDLQYRYLISEPENYSRWTNAVANNITLGKYGKTSYQIMWSSRITINARATKKSDVNDSGLNCEYLILNRDINLGNFDYNDNKKVAIVGNGHYLSFISQKGLFTANSKMMRDVNFIGIINLRNATSNKDYALFAGINKGELLNVSFFGNIRNISDSLGNVNSISVSNGERDDERFDSIQVNSFVSMTGLDGNVKTTLKSSLNAGYTPDNYSYNNHDVVIAGDGTKGQGGEDGERRNSSDSNRNGDNGEDAGAGGSIIVEDNFAGICRAGAAGTPGYGGNGAHGAFVINKVVGGGAGGKVGKTNETGTVTGAKGLTQNKSLNETQVAGNGGIGGFGRVVENKYYSSSAGGDSGAVDNPKKGSNGKGNLTWKNSYGINNTFMYGGQSSFSISRIKIQDEYEMWFGSPRAQYFHDMKTKFTENTGAPLTIGNNFDDSDTKSGKGLRTMQIYSSTQIDAEYVWIVAYYKVKVHKAKNTVWTSGECLNGAGECGWATT